MSEAWQILAFGIGFCAMSVIIGFSIHAILIFAENRKRK
jgi:hypothetical protein